MVEEINYSEDKNLIILKDLYFANGNFNSLKSLQVKTYKSNSKNNEFSIELGKNIMIKGSKFDARNLPKFFNRAKNQNQFSQINKDIEVNIKNIIAPLSENLKNFKLIGKIKKGKFVKISSKGDFGQNNFLDISMSSDKKDKKKYLEIYSDLTKPLLTEYGFFKGLTGGKLLFSSIFEKESFKFKTNNRKF